MQFSQGDQVRVRAVRKDLEATVLIHEGDHVLVRFHVDGKEARVPVACVYR